MSNPGVVVVVTLALIVASAFFVMIEFSLLGARRHRLEVDADRSASARAAIRGIDELTVMLAGAQLGITACTFALGAVTKPAVDAWLGPALGSLGVPGGIADTAAFILSLLLVTFLHLVVGEMAPKSWVIAAPERAARLIGLPSRAFIWVFRPLLVWVNRMANRLVAASGVEPVDSAAVGGQDADTIRHLVEHSASVGALESSIHSPVAGALDLEYLTVGSLVDTGRAPTAVAPDATVEQVQDAAARTDHMRILLVETGQPEVVHVRDTLLEPADAPARPLARSAMPLEKDTPVYEALSLARSSSEQLMVVMDGEEFLGVITVSDILRKILPEPRPAGASAE
ncbi:MAG TPA: DUF21 domain-containing protein [Candidatus Dietzia merdigallinarum]|nr:DUF21 domain-containing protein [Candidatus Dietzia merdigallinarum]